MALCCLSFDLRILITPLGLASSSSSNNLFIFHYSKMVIHESLLQTCNKDGIKSVSTELEHKLNILLKLFIILYADDTVLMAESATELLDSFSNYTDI